MAAGHVRSGRDHRHYTVILGVFANSGQADPVTLAQVFWSRDTSQRQPSSFFVTAERALSIGADFTDFGSDIAALRKRLSAQGHGVHDHFTDYGVRTRRLLGIQSEQALDLFHQTISMKSVGNLTDFVRQHMLEAAPDLDGRIEKLIGYFDDLTRAHEAVAAARAQLAQLDPLLDQCGQHDRLATRISEARRVRDAVRYWLAECRVELADADLLRLTREIEVCDDVISALESEVGRRRGDERALAVELAGAGGGRVVDLEGEISTETATREERHGRVLRYAALARDAGLPAADDPVGFAHAAERAQVRRVEVDDDLAVIGGRISEATFERRQAQLDGDHVRDELQGIQGRASNIDARSLALRATLATASAGAKRTCPSSAS